MEHNLQRDATLGTPLPTHPPSGARYEEVEVCPNCGSRLVGPFCASCGQQQRPLRLPVHRFLNDAVKEYFGIDGRLWRTVGLLFFRPGRLTREFFEGRRVRYLRPLRIYLTTTLFFFFLITILDPVGRVEGSLVRMSGEMEPDREMLAGDRLEELNADLAERPLELARQRVLVDSLRARTDSLRAGIRNDGFGRLDDEARESLEETFDDLFDDYEDEERDLQRMQRPSQQQRVQQLQWQRDQLATYPADSLIKPDDLDQISRLVFPESDDIAINTDLPGWMPGSRALEDLKTSRTGAERSKAVADLMRSAIRRLPTVMFLVLPIFALILKLIYIRRDWYYSEHLIFGLHTHAFAFLVFSVVTLLFWIGRDSNWAGMIGASLLAAIPLYFYLALKRVYAQGWIKTGLKFLMLGWLYFFVLLIGVVLSIVLAAAL